MGRPAWYGSDPTWRVPFEREAFRTFGKRLTVELSCRPISAGGAGSKPLGCGRSLGGALLSAPDPDDWTLIYRIDGLAVSGRTDRVPVTVVFRRYRYVGQGRWLDGRDFPQVYADPEQSAPHRFNDDALCLYFPGDSEAERWTADKGLPQLMILASDHLFFEDVYRDTRVWIGREAPHGFPDERKRAA